MAATDVSLVGLSRKLSELEKQVRFDFESNVFSANGDVQNVIEFKLGLALYFSQVEKCIYAEKGNTENVFSSMSSTSSNKIQVSSQTGLVCKLKISISEKIVKEYIYLVIYTLASYSGSRIIYNLYIILFAPVLIVIVNEQPGPLSFELIKKVFG